VPGSVPLTAKLTSAYGRKDPVPEAHDFPTAEFNWQMTFVQSFLLCILKP